MGLRTRLSWSLLQYCYSVHTTYSTHTTFIIFDSVTFGIMANVDKGRSKWEENSQGKSNIDVLTVISGVKSNIA
jgi:hypothetical protein